MNDKKNKKGFTLVEVLSVLIIMGILATLIVASIGKYKERAADEYINSLEGQMELAAKSYYSDHPNELPRGQIENGEKIYSTKIMASTLADAGYFTNELVDQNGNSCEDQSYAIANNINSKISYDVCLICNGKVLNESAYCKLSGFEVTNTLPYCSVQVENMQHNVKKLTVYTNKTNPVISHDITAASDGNYYVYKPGTYRFTVENNEGLTADCQTTVYMEEDKVKPSCNATVVSTTNTTYTVNFSFSDNISLKSVTNPKTGGKLNDYMCSYGNIVDNGYTGNIVIDRGTSDKTYTMTVTDCNNNTYSCSVNVPKKVTSSGGSSSGGEICIGSACDNDCNCEDYWDHENCVAYICNPRTCKRSTQTINNCTPSGGDSGGGSSSCKKVCTPGASSDYDSSTCRYYQCSSDGCSGYWLKIPGCTAEENPGTGCFLSGTKIHTKNGLKNIEDIKVGDYVLSYNKETKQTEYNRVYDTYIHTKNNEELFELTINGKVLKVTAAHRFYVKEKGTTEFIWKEAKELKVGDILLDSNNKEQKITNINYYLHFGTVYNFAVENNHNYYVTENGYLVHNDKCGPKPASGKCPSGTYASGSKCCIPD
ncbi:MAG: polymorphic toxin-type HINT domain-containing protein [bacterium]|nr:polymorphic toxin-type HINT domain-containing protein [bacterium]